MTARPKVAAGMNAADRATGLLDDFFEARGVWPDYDTICALHEYIYDQCEGISSVEGCEAFAHDALVHLGWLAEAILFDEYMETRVASRQ